MHLHAVVEQITKSTGVFFIYSSNKIDANKLVSLSVKDKTLNDVLLMLEQQLDLSFKMRGQHVIIKSVEEAKASASLPVQPRQLLTTSIQNSKPVIDSLSLIASIRKNVRLNAFENAIALPSSEYLKKRPELQLYFDTSMLRKIPVHYIQKINLKNRHSGWFASAGLMANDYSRGFELRAGIRSLYAVYSPSWRKSGKYYGSYGLGTSLLLERSISFHPVYMYSMNREEFTLPRLYLQTAENNMEITARHHQFKFQFQYAFSKNFNIRLGPSFNYRSTTFYFQKPDVIFVSVAGDPSAGMTYFHQVVSSLPVQSVKPATSAVPREIQVIRTWMGWETTLSYKINFFQRQ